MKMCPCKKEKDIYKPSKFLVIPRFSFFRAVFLFSLSQDTKQQEPHLVDQKIGVAPETRELSQYSALGGT